MPIQCTVCNFCEILAICKCFFQINKDVIKDEIEYKMGTEVRILFNINRIYRVRKIDWREEDDIKLKGIFYIFLHFNSDFLV